MHPTMNRVFAAGVVGTILSTLMIYFVSPYLRGGPVDIAAVLSGLLGGSVLASIVATLLIGIVIIPAVYSLVLYRVLAGSPEVRGTTLGLILWVISQTIVMPVMGDGFFSARAGGVPTVLGSLMGHMVYGLSFGVVAGGAHEARLDESDEFESQTHMRRAG